MKNKRNRLEKDRLIAELQQGNNKLTEEQLNRIDEAYEGINKKTSESMQLFKQIGQNVVSALSDAFMSLLIKPSRFVKCLQICFAPLLVIC
jgi:hypothetical protein